MTIPREWWSDAHLSDGDAPYSLVAHGRAASSEWHALLFNRAAMEKLWPAPAIEEVHSAPSSVVSFLAKEERRKGPKRRYIGELYRVLRWTRHRDGTLYHGSAFALAREIRRGWKSSAPALPAFRDGRSTTLETAIKQTRDGLDADIAAGITPEFPGVLPESPSTMPATLSR